MPCWCTHLFHMHLCVAVTWDNMNWSRSVLVQVELKIRFEYFNTLLQSLDIFFSLIFIKEFLQPFFKRPNSSHLFFFWFLDFDSLQIKFYTLHRFVKMYIECTLHTKVFLGASFPCKLFWETQSRNHHLFAHLIIHIQILNHFPHVATYLKCNVFRPAQ